MSTVFLDKKDSISKVCIFYIPIRPTIGIAPKKRKIADMMNSSNEIAGVAWQRINDARTLCENGCWECAFYIAGYAVELMLKARICRRWDTEELFDENITSVNVMGITSARKSAKIHDIDVLLIYSGLRDEFHEKWMYNTKTGVIVKDFMLKWSENCRYKSNGYVSQRDATNLINLLSADEGILKWIEYS